MKHIDVLRNAPLYNESPRKVTNIYSDFINKYLKKPKIYDYRYITVKMIQLHSKCLKDLTRSENVKYINMD